MAEVALREGLPQTTGQSPFAIARGQTFERILFRDDAKVLREALVEAGVVETKAKGLADFRLRMNGGRLRDHDEAIEATSRLLKDLAVGKAKSRIIASATIRLPRLIMLPETILVADVVVVTGDKKSPVLMVGEIKTYPDRGGYTDGDELAQARAQAGVYVHGLRTALRELHLESKITVADQGFLVLSRPGVNRPNVRPGEDLRFQAWRAQRGFSQLEDAAKNLPPPGDKDPVAAIQAAATDYHQECVAFCDRAPGCFSRAVQQNDPMVLGEDVARFLGKTPLQRAVALIAGEAPADDAERDLAHRLGLST